MAAAATVEQGIWAAAEGLTPPLRGNHRLDQSFDLDLRLVERCLAGDETAWEDLVKTHTRRVYAICYRFTGTDSEAQDLTQDVFLRLFKTLRSFRSGEGLADADDAESADRQLPENEAEPGDGFD
jgi:RNA polymerase sigma-70 factor (ECF subfamily)